MTFLLYFLSNKRLGEHKRLFFKLFKVAYCHTVLLKSYLNASLHDYDRTEFNRQYLQR